MLYSPERDSLAGAASTGNVLPHTNTGAGTYPGTRLTLHDVKEADKRRMSRGKKVVLSKLATRAAEASSAIVLAFLVTGASPAAHAQSASSWNKKGADAELHHDWDTAYEDYRKATEKKP